MSCVQGHPAQPTWVAQMHDTLFRNVGRHKAQLAARGMGPIGLGPLPALHPQHLRPPEPSTTPPQESRGLAALRSPALTLLPVQLAAEQGHQSGGPGLPGLLQQQHQPWARPAEVGSSGKLQQPASRSAQGGLRGGLHGGDQDGCSSFMSWTQEETQLDPRETGRLVQGLQGRTTWLQGQVGTCEQLNPPPSPLTHLVQGCIIWGIEVGAGLPCWWLVRGCVQPGAF